MDRGGGEDPFAELKEAREEYKVYDSHYEKIGKVDDLVVNEDGRVVYIGVKAGFFGTNSTLIPVEMVRVNDKRRLIEVSESAETIKDAPHFGKSEELTPELETRVRAYFELGDPGSSREREPRDPYPAVTTSDDERVDVAPGERAASQEGSVPASGAPREERPMDRQPEFAQPGEHVGERDRAPQRTSPEEQPISERLSEEDEGLTGWLTAGSGVTVHRIRR
ncbi:MAG: PRC-barrel domain-containing protein [Actinomycetota bacterium]|nr:PRC-barrel domain-containing protein [Actinomycetota bacterium]